jgi:hypothetical protein
MQRLVYLAFMGCGVGAVAGECFGHLGFWLTVGLGVGLLWRYVTPSDVKTLHDDQGSSRLTLRWSTRFFIILDRFEPNMRGRTLRPATGRLRIPLQRSA